MGWALGGGSRRGKAQALGLTVSRGQGAGTGQVRETGDRALAALVARCGKETIESVGVNVDRPVLRAAWQTSLILGQAPWVFCALLRSASVVGAQQASLPPVGLLSWEARPGAGHFRTEGTMFHSEIFVRKKPCVREGGLLGMPSL